LSDEYITDGSTKLRYFIFIGSWYSRCQKSCRYYI